MSAGWVFAGWVSWSKWFKQHYGVYPDKKYPDILVKLARMSKKVRDEIILPELMKMEGSSYFICWLKRGGMEYRSNMVYVDIDHLRKVKYYSNTKHVLIQ